ncbi:hypothetical protein SARC_05905 [Sphaeroforma arctica JP610]|uniref:Uncharacterized protein n=1 Tax=Sphaeroforma arctica JP610 TaxID=667725 RepID=A0A0L0G0P9_9EUKA|nr:hypothetical protein SARC_05905 [Sphaeroforma arctica JP610]KNC81783.1 hypothetical protein SARC_05905 [Sphaeroforma arctica JP610]|eukprot:XP_014155685.1 hypothetical protein SARC_05905 [Sphaeroforma arctica JP610]
MLGLVYFASLLGALLICLVNVASVFKSTKGPNAAQCISLILACATVAITWKHILGFMLIEADLAESSTYENSYDYFFSQDFVTWLLTWDVEDVTDGINTKATDDANIHVHTSEFNDTRDTDTFAENIFFVAYREVSRTWYGWFHSQNLLMAAIVLTVFVGEQSSISLQTKSTSDENSTGRKKEKNTQTTTTSDGNNSRGNEKKVVLGGVGSIYTIPGFSMLVVGYLGAMSLCFFLLMCFLFTRMPSTQRLLSNAGGAMGASGATKSDDTHGQVSRTNDTHKYNKHTEATSGIGREAVPHTITFKESVMGALALTCFISAAASVYLFPQTSETLSVDVPQDHVFSSVLSWQVFTLTTSHFRANLIFLHVILLTGFFFSRSLPATDDSRNIFRWCYYALSVAAFCIHVDTLYHIENLVRSRYPESFGTDTVGLIQDALQRLLQGLWLNDCQTSIGMDGVFMSVGTVMLITYEKGVSPGAMSVVSTLIGGTGFTLSRYLADRSERKVRLDEHV